jgi:Mrp family chromosome partitioning ATPase
LAFLIERLDTRVRTPERVESIIGLPAIGELPKPPDLSRLRRRVAMLEVPHGPYAESVRKLRANLEFASIDGELRALMVTSPVPGDGKTTVAADLAVAFARSGRTVALCDLDARVPSLGRALGLEGRRGLVDIVLGSESLERALIPISLAAAASQTPVAVSASVEAKDPLDDLLVGGSRAAYGDVGQLHFLPFGSRRPRDPGDFVSSESVRRAIARLRETHDVVIVDTAPLLPVSDARVVSEYVDSAVIVCGLRKSSKPDLRKVRRLVSVLPTHVYGVVVTGVPAAPGYGAYGAYGSLDPAPGGGPG